MREQIIEQTNSMLKFRKRTSFDEAAGYKVFGVITSIIGCVLIFVALSSFSNKHDFLLLLGYFVMIFFIFRFSFRLFKYEMILIIDKTNQTLSGSDNAPIKKTYINENLKNLNLIRIFKQMTSSSSDGPDEYSYVVALSYFSGDITAFYKKILADDDEINKKESLSKIRDTQNVSGIKAFFLKIGKELTAKTTKKTNRLSEMLKNEKNVILSYFTIRGKNVDAFQQARRFSENIALFLNFPIIDESSEDLRIIHPSEINTPFIEKIKMQERQNSDAISESEKYYAGNSNLNFHNTINVLSEGEGYVIEYKCKQTRKDYLTIFFFLTILGACIYISSFYEPLKSEKTKEALSSFDSLKNFFLHQDRYFKSSDDFFLFCISLFVIAAAYLASFLSALSIIYMYSKWKLIYERIRIDRMNLSYYPRMLFFKKHVSILLNELEEIRIENSAIKSLQAIGKNNVIIMGEGLNSDELNCLRDNIIFCVKSFT